jgi:hypothetical protein
MRIDDTLPTWFLNAAAGDRVTHIRTGRTYRIAVFVGQPETGGVGFLVVGDHRKIHDPRDFRPETDQ